MPSEDNLEQWRKHGDACRDNGLELKATANKFRSEQKYGRACSFTVLAWEELAKCLIFRMVEIGVMSFDLYSEDSGALLRVDRHVLTRHRERHTTIVITLFGADIAERLTGQVGPVDRPTESLTPESLSSVTPDMVVGLFPEVLRPPRLNEFSVKISADRTFASEVAALVTEGRKWVELKNRGLYVGVGSAEPERPSDVDQSELERLDKLFRRWFSTNQAIVEGFPPGVASLLQRAVSQVYGTWSASSPRSFLCQRCEREVALGRRKSPVGTVVENLV